jgi:flagellin-like hook-associated protein FlgL
MQTASLTLGMKNALTSLGDLQGQIEGTNKRLATGKKVNSALDNALNYFVADSFSSKARGLSTILDNIGLGLNVLKQTDKALTSIRTSLEQAEGTMRAALNTAGTNAKMVTTFNFRSPLTGAADASVNFFEAAGGTAQNRLQSGDAFVVQLVTLNAAGVIQSTLGSASITAGTATVQSVIDTINTTVGSTLNLASQSQRVQAYMNDAGNLVIENSVNGNDASGFTYAVRINMTNATGTAANTLDVFSFSGAVGANSSVITTGTASQSVVMAGSTTLQETRRSAAASFREVLNQVRNSALDAGYNGTNLLQGDFLRTVFNEDETTSLTTQGRRLDAAALGFSLDNVSASTGDALRDFQGDREISNGLAKIRLAKQTLSGIQTTFASNANLLTNRQDYTKFAVKNFNDGADLLTLADINEEGANLSSLQTRQQLAVTALSLANQSDQAILRLF